MTINRNSVVINKGDEMEKTWFTVEKKIVDREDLLAYEKLLLISLARLSEDNIDVSSEILAKKMGCRVSVVENTIRDLLRKGDLQIEGQETYNTLLSSDEKGKVKPAVFSDFEGQGTFVSKKYSDSKVDTLVAMIDEDISYKQAKIILAFADNDLVSIEEKYKVAKASQIKDKIGHLIQLLQTQERKPRVIKADQVNITPSNNNLNTQINQRVLNAYRKKK